MSYTNLKIKDCCIKCGSCLGCGFEFLSSANDGSIVIKDGTMFNEDSTEFKSLKESCPMDAFEIIETKPLTKQDFVNELEVLKNYTARYPKASDLKFNKSEYSIDIPMASGERRYEYNSYEAAERAAENEIYNKMYSRIDVIILKIITEYRVKYLKPYYSKSKEDNSFFEKSNQEVSKMLNRLVSILKSNNLASDIPTNFSNIDIFPENDLYWKMLSKGQIMSDEMISAVTKEFRSGSWSDISNYVNSCDYDEIERIEGTDWRGNLKTRDKYCYRNVHKAFQELAGDLLNACYYADTELENRAVEIASALIDEYNKLLKNVLNEKIKYLDKKISLLPSDNKKAELEKYDNIIRRVGHNSDGFLLNGELIDRNMTEIFVAESKNAQYFFDGTVLKKKYISGGIIHNDTIFIDRNFEYRGVCGYNGVIMFIDNRCDRLYVYNCITDNLKEIDSKVYRIYYKNDYLIYTTISNIEDRYSQNTIKCCRIDGNDKRTICYPSGGFTFIENITDSELTYYTLQNSQKKTINWRNGGDSTGVFSGLLRFR